jgi:hypothetical protein
VSCSLFILTSSFIGASSVARVFGIEKGILLILTSSSWLDYLSIGD